MILWVNDQGLQLAWVPLIWAAASAIKAVLPGAILFGLVWQFFGPVMAFSINGLLSMGAVLLLKQQYRK